MTNGGSVRSTSVAVGGVILRSVQFSRSGLYWKICVGVEAAPLSRRKVNTVSAGEEVSMRSRLEESLIRGSPPNAYSTPFCIPSPSGSPLKEVSVSPGKPSAHAAKPEGPGRPEGAKTTSLK